MEFDFLAAITRNLELRLMLHRLKRTQDVTDPWESWLRNQIQTSEQDITEARNTKMTAARNSGHSVRQFEIICTAIIHHLMGGVYKRWRKPHGNRN